MTRFHFERPDGPPSNNAQNILIHLNEFIPPQGFDGGVPPSDELMAYEDLDIMAYEPDWIDTAFQQRIPLTINAGQVPSTQTDFPLLINDTYPDLIGEVEAELRFAGIDNIQLEYEIQKFDNITGELIAWFKKTSVSDGDIINIYFDNPAAVDEQDPGAVWNTNYVGVYHLNGTGNDSTINAQDLTIFGTTTVPAKIGDGINFPGTVNDYLIRNPYSVFPSTTITSEFWIKSSGSGDGFISYAVPSNSNHFITFNQMNVNTMIDGVSNTNNIAIDDDVFHHVVITWRSSDGQITVYLDGVQVLSQITQQGFSFTNGGAIVLGQDQDSLGGGFQPGQALDGIMDEVRFSNSFKTSDYVETTFNNQNNPGAFYSTGTVESLPLLMAYES